MAPIRYLLLQVRLGHDPMREHEVACFTKALDCDAQQIDVVDLINERPTPSQLATVDAVLLGGSGDFSVVKGGPWLEEALNALREIHLISKPTFASCWGFQAMARALGGTVVSDPARAELGTLPVRLTDHGQADPILGAMGSPFLAHIGHQDTVDRLPEDAVLLASTDRVKHHAFRFAGKPIYCTQFHPELEVQHMIDRLNTYPTYVENISGMSHQSFLDSLKDTLGANTILRQFRQHYFGA